MCRSASIFRHRCAVLLMLLAGIPGCSRWRVEPLAPGQLVEQRRPKEVQVRRSDGERLVLRKPWMEGDTLAGLSRSDTARVAVADVSAVAVPRFSSAERAGLSIVAGGVILGVMCAMVCHFGPTLAD